jgi:hypothetical protein
MIRDERTKGRKGERAKGRKGEGANARKGKCVKISRTIPAQKIFCGRKFDKKEVRKYFK